LDLWKRFFLKKYLIKCDRGQMLEQYSYSAKWAGMSRISAIDSIREKISFMIRFICCT